MELRCQAPREQQHPCWRCSCCPSEPCDQVSCSPGGLRITDPLSLPSFCSWTVKQQCVNLLAEGLWEELLDDEQPNVTVMDWCVPCPTA
jgi:hypothetical protein